jgi:uncharacterized protein (DUF952 family)
MLIYKIVPRRDWEAAPDPYEGSTTDQADGFLHFSTAPQLAETLSLYYADQDDLLLVAVESTALADNLAFEYAPSRREDFPHLFAPLAHRDVLWTRPIGRNTEGFVLPPLD